LENEDIKPKEVNVNTNPIANDPLQVLSFDFKDDVKSTGTAQPYSVIYPGDNYPNIMDYFSNINLNSVLVGPDTLNYETAILNRY
jgi:hypothetical protein